MSLSSTAATIAAGRSLRGNGIACSLRVLREGLTPEQSAEVVNLVMESDYSDRTVADAINQEFGTSLKYNIVGRHRRKECSQCH